MSKRNLKPSGEGWVQLIAGIGFIVLLIVINIVDPTFYPTMWHLATSGSMEEVAEYIQSFGPMAMVVSMVLDIFVNAVGFLPSIFISTANGLVFGMWPGIIISWLAETIGVVISFYIMRYFLRDTADKLIAKSTVLMKVDDFSGKNIGTDIVNFQENMGRLGIIVLVAGVVYFILWKVYKNYINKKNAEQEHDPNA